MSDGYDTPAELYEAQGKENNQAAIDEREGNQPEPETHEEYLDRISKVPGIFGDIDTTAGASASQTDVPSAQNELATKAAAAAEANEEVSSDTADGVADPAARRQLDVDRTVPSADEIDEQVDEDDSDTAEASAQPDEDTPAEELVDQVQASDDIEFVRAQTENSRVTVARAANERVQELEANV